VNGTGEVVYGHAAALRCRRAVVLGAVLGVGSGAVPGIVPGAALGSVLDSAKLSDG